MVKRVQIMVKNYSDGIGFRHKSLSRSLSLSWMRVCVCPTCKYTCNEIKPCPFPTKFIRAVINSVWRMYSDRLVTDVWKIRHQNLNKSPVSADNFPFAPSLQLQMKHFKFTFQLFLSLKSTTSPLGYSAFKYGKYNGRATQICCIKSRIQDWNINVRIL